MNEQEINNNVNPQLIMFTKTYIADSFFPSLHRLCFRHFMHLRMGKIDNNFFVE